VARYADVVTPVLIRRARGGWLAVSPPNSVLKIGVVAESEVEARERFAEALVAWDRLRDARLGEGRVG
jgi:hypothetical protein